MRRCRRFEQSRSVCDNRRMTQYSPLPGAPVPPGQFPPAAGGGYQASQPSRTSGMAIASLISSLILCIPALSGLLAIIFGIFGIKQTRNPNVRGRGLAVAGIIIGVLNMIIGGVIFSLFGLGLFLGVGVYKATHNAAVQVVQDVSNGNTQAATAPPDASNSSP